ncbi:MAG: hypothetical protein RIR48_1707 [Bacteroidota bacterium]
MLIRISVFLAIILCVFTLPGNAQNNDNSPYSRYGIGDLADPNLNHTRQMGGLGASYMDGFHINLVNPASYAFLNSTAFDVGIFAKRTQLKDSRAQNTFWSGNLEYLSLAFPLRNPINEIYDNVKRDYKLAMAFALMQHSSVGYNIAAADSTSTGQRYTRNYQGGGGTYKVLWGNALKYKNVSFGLNLGYLFGKLKYENRLEFSSTEFAYSDLFGNDFNMKGFLWNAGVMYTDIMNKKSIESNKTVSPKRISIGIHANSATSFSTEYTLNHILLQQLPGNIFNTDTVSVKDSISGKGKLPAEFGIGATYYSGEKFSFGFNYNTSLWSNYFNEANGDKAGALKNSQRVSVGGHFRPDYKSFDNFFDRVYYRYGVYYASDPRVINGTQIEAYGITFGVGMPFVFQRKVSHMNLGFDLGMRGNNTPISEKFVKISLGVTFNDDEWFLKRKYN